MVQLGMRNFTTSELDSRWFFEACASWIEDVAYDDVNDYLQYLPSYFARLDRSLRTFDGIHEYGAGLFFHMLEKKYGYQLIRRLWETFARNELYESFENVLSAQGSSLALELTDHMLWNYFTGRRADPHGYPEAADYPELVPPLTQSVEKTISFREETELLSARYVRIEPQDFGDLTVSYSYDNPKNWNAAAVFQPSGGPYEVITCNDGVLISDVNASTEIVLIAVNTRSEELTLLAASPSFPLLSMIHCKGAVARPFDRSDRRHPPFGSKPFATARHSRNEHYGAIGQTSAVRHAQGDE